MLNRPFFNLSSISILQGRLVDSERKGFIQYFPSNTWAKELKIANENKIKFIEWVVSYENIKLNPLFYKSGTNIVKKYIKRFKVKIRSADFQFFVKKPFYKASGKEYYKRLNLLKKVIINSQKIGIKFIILPVLEKASIKNGKEEKIFIKEILKLRNYLNKKSYILLESDYSPKKFLNLMKKINSNKIGINYDTGNSAAQGYNFSNEKIYIKYIKNIHLKDRKFKGSSVPFGQGSTDFKKIFSILRKFNYKGYFSLQCARSQNNEHIDEIFYNYSFLNKYNYA